ADGRRLDWPTMRRVKTAFLLLVVSAAVTAVAVAAGAPPRQIDPDADRMLKEMTDYLAGLQTFKVQSDAIDEVVLTSGQKIHLASESVVSVQRPNRLRSEQ